MTDAPTNAAPKAPGIKRVQLTTEKTLKLSAWIEKNRSWILSETPTLVYASQEAASGLGFPITPINFANVVKAMNFPWPGREGDIDQTLRQLRNDVAYIAAILIGLDTAGGGGTARLRHISASAKEELFDGHSH